MTNSSHLWQMHWASPLLEAEQGFFLEWQSYFVHQLKHFGCVTATVSASVLRLLLCIQPENLMVVLETDCCWWRCPLIITQYSQSVKHSFSWSIKYSPNRSKKIKLHSSTNTFCHSLDTCNSLSPSKCYDNLNQPAAASHLYPAEAWLAAQPAYEKLWQCRAHIRLWSCFMGQHGPLIWDGYLYGFCFILRNYT